MCARQAEPKLLFSRRVLQQVLARLHKGARLGARLHPGVAHDGRACIATAPSEAMTGNPPSNEGSLRGVTNHCRQQSHNTDVVAW